MDKLFVFGYWNGELYEESRVVYVIASTPEKADAQMLASEMTKYSDCWQRQENPQLVEDGIVVR